MPIETNYDYISSLNATWPAAADPKSGGDDHIRGIKAVLKNTFPNFAGPMTVAHDQVASKTDIANAQFSSALPGQSGSAGKFLSTDGSAASWQSPFPAQASNAGKFLTTDGGTAAWGNVLKASTIRFADGSDATKQAAFDLSSLTTSTTRTYTLPDASGTLALRTDAAMQLLGQATVGTAVANIDFLNIFTSAYDKYIVEFEGLITSSASTNLVAALASAGAVVATSNYFGPGTDGNVQTASTSFLLAGAIGNTAAGAAEGTLEIRNVNSASALKGFGSRYFVGAAGYSREGGFAGTAAISGFRLTTSGGANFTAGTVRVYGIKNS